MIFVSRFISEKCLAVLEARAGETRLLPPFSRLQRAVASHADMLLFPTDGGLIVHGEYYEANKALFEGVNVITADGDAGPDYPNDISLNALDAGGGILLSLTERTDGRIKALFKTHIRVRQGYTRCSCAKVGNGFITSDRGIFVSLEKAGKAALLIRPGHVALPGCEYGFIGGASVRLSDSETAFFGDVTRHPDYAEMADFARGLGAALVSLSDEELTDIGGGVEVMRAEVAAEGG